MHKTKLSLLLTCCISLHAEAQALFRSVLYDKMNIEPIGFATIKVLNKPFGTFSSEEGKFEIEVSANDSLLITCIGYQTRIVYATASDTIFLEPVVKELSPVVINQKKVSTIETLGIRAKKDFRWGPAGFAEEFAQKIYLHLKDDEYCQVNKVILSAAYFNPERPVLLHIYSVHPTEGIPDQELLSKNYIITKEHFKKGKIVIDIEKENLFVDAESVFVSFAWLGYGKKFKRKNQVSTLLNMTHDLSLALTYSRSLSSSSYEWFKAPQIYGKIINTIFTIEVKKFK